MANFTARRLDRRAPNSGVRVAKCLSCDRMDSLFFSGEPPPPPPPLSYRAEKRGDHGNLPYAHANFRAPPFFNTLFHGGLPGKKCESIRSQLRPLATRTPSLGHTEFGAHRVWGTPSLGHTEFGAHRVWGTPSLGHTEFGAHRVWDAAVKAPGCKVCHRLGIFFLE